MQDYNTIIGVIQMRQNNCSFSVIEARYHIGSGTAQRILKRYEASGMTVYCIIKIPKVADKNGESCISILEKIAG